MRILLIGGKGFIGDYLLERLKNRREYEVVVACRQIQKIKKIKNISFQEIDLEQNNNKLAQLMNNAEVAVILTRPNEQIIKNLIIAGKDSKFLKKIVYLSSILVYPDTVRRQGEKSHLAPLTEHEKNKCKEEKLLSSFAKNNNIKICIARISNIYGDVKNKGIINFIFLAILNGRPLTINGDGKQLRDYIFIEDVANLLLFLIFFKQKKQREIFNVCTGLGLTIIEVIKTTEKICKKRLDLIFEKPILEKQAVVGNNKRILKFSGYQLKYNITKGLNKTYDNYSRYFKNNNNNLC